MGCDSRKVKIEGDLPVQHDAYLHLSITDCFDAPWLCNTDVRQIAPFGLAQAFLSSMEMWADFPFQIG